MATKSIMLVGVGGQGTLLASRILGNTLLSQGYDVKVSEVHGMSQRGGSVVTYIKYGEEVFSPVIEKAKLMLSSPLKNWKLQDGSLILKRAVRSSQTHSICPLCPLLQAQWNTPLTLQKKSRLKA